MKRTDIVTVVLAGDLGKPRPALVLQSDLFFQSASVVVAPMTSDISDAPFARVTVHPTGANGLRKPTQIMLDKITNLRREKVGKIIGTLENDRMAQVEKALSIFLGLA
ncbi:type II toxin-antitoxin system PemK/MazF family toxin [Devosia aurantiaca]|uniref:Type II toxin-antitoxin system PemK/MazF family toxin n=1 Tax=Devosia aurantiaca TaxID=2714858 RepID=A0A6M1SCN6_9HYPH|nr:type II toxin-antitoxin system PemK/MazF family toxin [Devosia aurantiaca]NGP17467.1 type II toxin-antitoxin system PemK/MazF family toxin [Devosia aurantiaca]